MQYILTLDHLVWLMVRCVSCVKGPCMLHSISWALSSVNDNRPVRLLTARITSRALPLAHRKRSSSSCDKAVRARNMRAV